MTLFDLFYPTINSLSKIDDTNTWTSSGICSTLIASIPRLILLCNCFINVLQIAALFTRFQHLQESINEFSKQNLEVRLKALFELIISLAVLLCFSALFFFFLNLKITERTSFNNHAFKMREWEREKKKTNLFFSWFLEKINNRRRLLNLSLSLHTMFW